MSQRFRSVVDMFHHRVAASPDAEAMYGRRGSEWYSLTWRQCGERVRRIACGLASLGLEKGQRVSILAMTRPEWVLMDLGILAAGGATTTIYTSNTPEECSYILANSESAFCFVENAAQADKLVAERGKLAGLRRVIWLDGEPPSGGPTSGDPWMMGFAELEAQGEVWDRDHPGRIDEVAAGVGPEDLATVIYTAGTTGLPKGVMLTHDNWVYEGEAIEQLELLTPEDKQYLFLPLAHSFAKVLELAFIRVGSPTAVDGDIDALVENLGTARPTIMAAVPRVFEKVYNRVVSGAKEGGALKYRIFLWAVAVGRQVSALRQRQQQPGGWLAFKHRLADKLVYSKLKARFGGRIRFFISGGAPLAREIAEFFHAADILVLEGYGLTETSAATFVNRLHHFKFGTVGPPVPGTEVKIADDGEVLVKGRGVMKGYYKLPEATAETLEPDGWFHTGDIGEVDGDGFLKITDRKKDLIVTAGGKNVAPQFVENLLKASSSFISQAVMIGDRRPFCTAIVTLNGDTVGAWAREAGIAFDGYAELARNPRVKELMWGEVEKVNSRLASYETIKKIHVPENDFSQEGGELTPKMSIKRRVVEKKYAAVIDSFYRDTVAAM
jgi:long-chain acyl-CoA synthetase